MRMTLSWYGAARVVVVDEVEPGNRMEHESGQRRQGKGDEIIAHLLPVGCGTAPTLP